jgi:hypothetical protein
VRATTLHRSGAPIALFAAIAVAYRAAYTASFLNWDDNRFLTENPLFAGGVAHYVRSAVTEVQFEAYQPLHLLSYLPDRLLWPGQALGFHLLNLALLYAIALVVYRLASRRAGAAAALLAALVFAMHPLAVEPVMWITARKDLVSLLCLLAALSLEDRDHGPRWLAVGLFVAALLAKSASLWFPVVLIAWLVCMRRLPWRAAWRRSAPYWPPAVLAAAVVTVIWHRHGMIAPIGELRWVDVPATFGSYLERAVAPIQLSPLYPEHAATPAALLLLGVGAVLVTLRRRVPPYGWFVAASFIAVLAPVSNVVPLLRSADRYALPALALTVPALAMFLDGRKRQRLALALTLLVVIGETGVTARQADSWTDSVSLWRAAVRSQPDAVLAHVKLGETLRDAGEYTAAAAQYEDTIRIAPDKLLGHIGLFYLHAVRAEHAQLLATGTASRWLLGLRDALVDPERYAQLFGEIASSGCTACKDELLVLGLHTWPQPDDALLFDAKEALDRGVPDEALVFLGAVRVPDDRYARLAADIARRSL